MTLWLLGGHDPTHGAGLYRDLVTAKAIAPTLERRFAVTALTTQGHGGPAEAVPVAAARLRRRVRSWPRPLAIKVGLVPDPLAQVVAQLVADIGAPVVVDPVLRASDGGSLGASPEGLAPLLAVATVVTPNRDEARALVTGEDGGDLLIALGQRFGSTAVLLKGGHESDPATVTDRLIHGTTIARWSRPRIPGPDPRGTGCALATAVAAGLACGQRLESAVAAAVAWLDRARIRWHRGCDGRAHLPDPTVAAPARPGTAV
ncbi:MAG: bifunctional hydroxymethylpyrimidine kinase/phosphomethylpyrimidine kinase [Deltaproteobacteria bacterium]|nr:bifunctional hydroxymethylpyrimidine kinase/phosphomethylpyrimidine kinase [Deltaproteobacteria bacterium]